MPPDVRTPFSTALGGQEPRKERVFQVELKDTLRLLGARANSPSAFRFTTEAGNHIGGLHEIALEQGLLSAHPSIQPRFPGTLRRRKKGEKARLSSFVHLHFPPTADVEEILRKLRALPEVKQATEYKGFSAPWAAASVLGGPRFPQDPLLGTGVEPDLQWYIFRCKIDQAWKRVSGAGVVIADVDYGTNLGHEDLQNRVERTYNALDGTQDVSAGPTDHGTAVLGLAGAASNTVGIAGVAFGATLWAIQYNDHNNPALNGNALANGIHWASLQDSGGRRVVINVEAQNPDDMGNCEQDSLVAQVIQFAIGRGCVVCVAAGNAGIDAGFDENGKAIPPTGSILVGATDFDANSNPRATAPGQSSNYGDRIVVSAPGDGNHDITCATPYGYTTQFGGTSGAAAKVAGVIALMLEANPKLTHDEIKDILKTTGDDLNTDQPIGKFLNADAAVQAAAQQKTA